MMEKTNVVVLLKCFNVQYIIFSKTRTLNKNAICCVLHNIEEDSDVILYLKYKGKEEGEKKTN